MEPKVKIKIEIGEEKFEKEIVFSKKEKKLEINGIVRKTRSIQVLGMGKEKKNKRYTLYLPNEWADAMGIVEGDSRAVLEFDGKQILIKKENRED